MRLSRIHRKNGTWTGHGLLRKFTVDTMLPTRILDRIKRSAHLARGECWRIIPFRVWWYQNAIKLVHMGDRRTRRAYGKKLWKAYVVSVRAIRT